MAFSFLSEYKLVQLNYSINPPLFAKPRMQVFKNLTETRSRAVKRPKGLRHKMLCRSPLKRFMLFLLGTVDTVACIAQAGHDVAVLVQVVILCAQVDIHIRVCLVQCLDAFRCAQ